MTIAMGAKKKGATSYLKYNGKTRGRPGTLRRLVDVLEHYDVTWDLYSVKTDDLIGMLPREFSRFVSSPTD
jgi:hypothetical protein